MNTWNGRNPNQWPRQDLDGIVTQWSTQIPQGVHVDLQRSVAYGLEHQYDADPLERAKAYVHAVNEAHHNSNTKPPAMTGVAYNEDSYHATYGTSLPYDNHRENVRQSRLQRIDPRHLRGLGEIVSRSPVGGCCEYVTLEPYFKQRAGMMRVIHSMSLRTDAKSAGSIKLAPFCSRCKKLATNAANLYPGLTIIDDADGTLYQSAATAAAYQAAEIQSRMAQAASGSQYPEMFVAGQQAKLIPVPWNSQHPYNDTRARLMSSPRPYY
ncbi:hypothetical protein B0H11DRAFT_1334440 [Mycena galericulata]|nr:hypothetical protein B0H11DRAFT_1334440 [Mycena galericulata]